MMTSRRILKSVNCTPLEHVLYDTIYVNVLNKQSWYKAATCSCSTVGAAAIENESTPPSALNACWESILSKKNILTQNELLTIYFPSFIALQKCVFFFFWTRHLIGCHFEQSVHHLHFVASFARVKCAKIPAYLVFYTARVMTRFIKPNMVIPCVKINK